LESTSFFFIVSGFIDLNNNKIAFFLVFLIHKIMYNHFLIFANIIQLFNDIVDLKIEKIDI